MTAYIVFLGVYLVNLTAQTVHMAIWTSATNLNLLIDEF